ncbi:MAG: site-2 protease family protein [Candidatus Levyibacteriota bacterium]
MDLLIGVVILIFSAILHEVMHGWVADKLGDPTARLMGRLTLNPIPHIDPLMSVVIPIILILAHSPIIFGAAKPVPVNPMHLHDGKKDFALVGLAGPLTNAVIAIIAAGLLHIVPADNFIAYILSLVVLYNLILAFINLIPIPPLDGSRVITFLLPDDLARKYLSIESFGIVILFLLLSFTNLGAVLFNLITFSMHLLGL